MKPKLILTFDDLQEKAVRHPAGRLIVVAGPGTGKTQVIIQRIIHLIEAEGVDPSSILALTFSRRAVREMREKVALGLSRSFSEIKISTFLSFCLDFVKHNFRALGYRAAPELLTSTELLAGSGYLRVIAVVSSQ
ncbi:DNA helicase II / ATP-dependent DNA helicase PcrA, partial [Candidatus Hakubella thermalkaliphila]